MDDDELEQTMRAGLTGRADRAQVDPSVVARARRDVARRRTTWVAVLGAAATVVVAVGVGAVVVDRGDTDRPVATDPSTPSSTAPTSAAVTAPTRTEYWHGVQVDVPGDWGYGNPVFCGDVPVGEPYVGRPITTTDDCGTFEPDATPTAPYVWFDVEGVPVGTVNLGDGWTRETVEVAGSTVAVAARDGATRERVLASAEPGELCPATRSETPRARYDFTDEGTGPMLSARVCAYRDQTLDSNVHPLVYARDLSVAVAEETFEAVEAAPAGESCDRAGFEVVVVSATYDDTFGSQDLERDVVYDLSCGVLRSVVPFEAEPRLYDVTEATVPWAGPEFRRLLTGPSSAPWSSGRFIGLLG